jgi:hypothetical protein
MPLIPNDILSLITSFNANCSGKTCEYGKCPLYMENGVESSGGSFAYHCLYTIINTAIREDNISSQEKEKIEPLEFLTWLELILYDACDTPCGCHETCKLKKINIIHGYFSCFANKLQYFIHENLHPNFKVEI